MSDTLSETMSDTMRKIMSERLNENMSKDMNETMSRTMTMSETMSDTLSDTVRDIVRNLAFDLVNFAKHHGPPTLNYPFLPLSWLDKASNERMECISFYFGTSHIVTRPQLLSNVLESSTNKP